MKIENLRPEISDRWLRFIIIGELLPAKRVEEVLDKGDQLCRILGKSVATAKGKRRKNDESGGDTDRD